MKTIGVLYMLGTALAFSGCDHCLRLCQYNFDYVPLLQEDYCESDNSCEDLLREVSYRYLSGKIRSNPCVYETRHSDCTNFALQVCSEILQSKCAKGFLQEEPELRKVNSLQEQLKHLDEESEEIEEELMTEISRQKQKYLKILNRLSELQVAV